jgi:hypothetical protein
VTRDVRQQLTSTNVVQEVEASLSYLAKIMHQMSHAANINSGAYSTTAANAIEIRIEKITQLFHSLDPFPFRQRDLDSDVEEFIVGWARELSPDKPLRIVVHLPETEASTPEAHEVSAAISQYFGYRARIIALDLRELFRVGRRAMAIGLTVLSFSVITGQTIVNLAPGPIGRVIEESLLIFGWVANWRPIEIFLYDWWPIIRRRNLYQRLSAAHVKLRPYKLGDQKRQAVLEK